jgi:hypothetical protein
MIRADNGVAPSNHLAPAGKKARRKKILQIGGAFFVAKDMAVQQPR